MVVTFSSLAVFEMNSQVIASSCLRWPVKILTVNDLAYHKMCFK